MTNEFGCELGWLRRVDGGVIPICKTHNVTATERTANGPEGNEKIVECPRFPDGHMFLGAVAEWESMRATAQRDAPSNPDNS